MTFKDAKRCKAKAKSTGERCQAPAMKGRDVCYHHGGATPRGAANANTKHGKYSKHLPKHLQSRYEKFAEDAEVRDLTENLALLDTRLSILAERLNVGDYGASYGKLRSLYIRARNYMRADNMKDFYDLWLEIGSVIEEGAKDYAVWSEIVQVNDQKRRMVATAESIDLKRHKAISINELMTLIARIAHAFEVANERAHQKERADVFSRELDKMLQFPEVG